jgi:hypothetical protein
MTKMVGLARPLKIEWMNKTVELVLADMTEDAIKTEISNYLSFEINSPTSLRKTRESLINVWAATSNGSIDLRETALSLYSAPATDKLPLHWCMLLVKYPIFSDVCALIGKIANIEETFKTAWVREKLYESWGERTTLDVPVKNILRTLVDFGTLEKVKTGVYKTKVRAIENERTICLFIMTLLALEQKAYYEIPELSRIPLFFPFEFNVSMEWLHNSPDFTLENFGGKTVLSAAKNNGRRFLSGQ